MKRFALLFALLLATPAYAQPTSGVDCPPGSIGSIGFTASDVCKARVVEFESRIKELGGKLCSDPSASSTKSLEERVAKEFGEIAKDCGDAILASENELTQHYLYSWLSGKSEGWGEDLTVHGVKLPESLRKYRETFTSSYGDGLEAAKLPGWYKSEAAFSEAMDALVAGARESLKTGSSWALSDAERKIERYKTYGGDADRVKFLEGMLARIKTPSTEAIPTELMEAYAKNRALRLNGANGFYTESCNANAAKDDSLTDALALAYAAHLAGNGPKDLEKLDSAVNAVKRSYSDFNRAEGAFGSEMAGAWMSSYVKKTYFADDSNAADVSAEMASALADAVNGPLRARYGLPALPANGGSRGDALGLAGSKFDSNDNLRVVFPGKCELVDVRHVNANGSTGDVVKEEGWDARGIYDVDSYLNNKDFPISELVFREPAGANKDKARSYDVTMKCGSQTKKMRMNIPPRPDSTGDIDYITAETTPPYDAMLADGKLNGLLVGGHHTRDASVSLSALKEMGFRVVSEKKDVSIKDRYFALLGEKGADGKPTLDYFVKDAHANGYAFDAGMFRANALGNEYVLEKRGPDGKPHRITLLGNRDGEGKEYDGAYETIEYSKYFDTMAARGDHHLFVANFSCWSDGKTAFEWDGIRSKNVKYVPTDKSASYWENYWRGMSSRENTFQIIRGLDGKMDYAKLRDEFSNFDDEVLMPDDPNFLTVMKDKVKSHRASSTGIPVRVVLEDSRPNS